MRYDNNIRITEHDSVLQDIVIRITEHDLVLHDIVIRITEHDPFLHDIFMRISKQKLLKTFCLLHNAHVIPQLSWDGLDHVPIVHEISQF